MNISYWFTRLWLFMSYPFRTTYIASVCGHKTKQMGPVTIGKAVIIMNIEDIGHKGPGYCLECLGQMSIRCVWCGESILVGEPITLYRQRVGVPIPTHAVSYIKNGRTVFVGCLDWNCADSGADICGYWMPPGVVEPIPPPIH